MSLCSRRRQPHINKLAFTLIAGALAGFALAVTLVVQPAQAGLLNFLAPFTPPGIYTPNTPPQTLPRMNAIKVYNSGVHEWKRQNLQGAAQCFQQALNFDPSMKEVHGALGQVLYDAGDYDGAFRELQQVTQDFPADSAYWCMLGLAASHLQRYDITLSSFQKYLQLKPNGGYADEARRSIAILQHTVFSDPQSDDRTSNYLSEFQATNLRRWNSNMLPLRVCIQTGTNIQGFDPAFENVLRESFNDWTILSDGRIQFALVNDPNQAQVVCRWTADKSELGGSTELGVTHSTWLANGNITHADMILLTIFDHAPHQQDVYKRAKAVYLHEIGHALGLGHSQEPWDIMYPLIAPSGLEFPLTLRDKNTLLALYNNDPLGLIAKQFGAALASAGKLAANRLAANGFGNLGSAGNGFGNNAIAATGFPAQGGINGFRSQLGYSAPPLPPQGAGVPNAFAQVSTDMNRPNAFMAPSSMVPPPMAAPSMATAAFVPSPNQGAFSAARPTMPLSRAELNANSMPPYPPSSHPARASAPSAVAPPGYGAGSAYAGGQPYGAPAAYAPGSSYQSPSGYAQLQPPVYEQAPPVAPSNIQQISDLNRAAAQATARRDFEDAISKLQDARHLAPNDQVICRNLGLALGNAANVAVQQGEYGRALQYYKNALDVLKDNADKSAYDQILSDYQSMVNKQSGAH
jgi:tetratricopeptide (TPR) repeat protein